MKNILTILILSFSLILASWRSEEPLITKRRDIYLYERKGTYYLRVDTETPPEDYEIINQDGFSSDFGRGRIKITGYIITVDNIKKIYAKYIEFEIPLFY